MTERPVAERTAVILSAGQSCPGWLSSWCVESGLQQVLVHAPDAVVMAALRSRPRLIVLDARGEDQWTSSVIAACARLKRDSFTAVIPVLALASRAHFAAIFASGADEVLRDGDAVEDSAVRVTAMLRRSDRDTDVHPSTRLPGTREIEAEIERRIAEREKFAVCYADLDFFKEFNDRYSYHRGNQVIQLLARLLHDVVKGLCGEHGFVGHIGGDDFLYVVPIAAMGRVADEVIRAFDELVPLQYSESDRRVGYFFGKDRRGQLHRVPLMTLSVGVVTNQRRRFRGAAEVSELATEMKTYAKTLPGSCWVVDRRRDHDAQTKPIESSSGGARVSFPAKSGGAR
jgi:diguanylate cyclase (GGDEF)-like protein